MNTNEPSFNDFFGVPISPAQSKILPEPFDLPLMDSYQTNTNNNSTIPSGATDLINNNNNNNMDLWVPMPNDNYNPQSPLNFLRPPVFFEQQYQYQQSQQQQQQQQYSHQQQFYQEQSQQQRQFQNDLFKIEQGIDASDIFDQFSFNPNISLEQNSIDSISGTSNSDSADTSDSEVDIETIEDNKKTLDATYLSLSKNYSQNVEKDSDSSESEDPILKDQTIQVLLKPARKNSHKYLSFFPSKIYCAPYKYDLLIRIRSDAYQDRKLDIILNSAETKTKLKCKSDDQVPIVIEKTKATQSSNDKVVEIMCRVRFNVCSFHYGKKPFTLSLTFSGEGKETFEYTTQPFSTYARKNDKDDIWDKEGSAPLYSEMASKSLRTRSRNSPRKNNKRKHQFTDSSSPKKRNKTSDSNLFGSLTLF